MSAWLSWANQATTMWTSAMVSATRRNQAAFARELARPSKAPSKTPAKTGGAKPTRRPKR